MSGKLRSGEVSPTPSCEGGDVPSNDTEYQPEEESVNLVTTFRSDQMAPRTRSQSSKSVKECGLPVSRSDSTTPVAAAASPNNAKRCGEDNQMPIKKRQNKCASNDSAHVLRNLQDHFRQEREYFENRLTKEREKLCQEIDILRNEMLEGAKREQEAAEKITDDTIISKWDTLRYNIRSVVLMLRSYEPINSEHTLDTLRLRIPEVSFAEVPDKYFGEFFEGLLELYIWSFVYEDVFSGSGSQWKGRVFEHFQAMRQEAIHDSLEDSKKLAELALWLSRAGEAVTSQLDKELQQPMADDFAESIFNMFQPHLKSNHQAQIKDVLGVVVCDATELVMTFVSSKALLVSAWPRRELVSRDGLATHSEIEHVPSSESNARFIGIRPALVKYGNADGEKHDVSVILCESARLYF